MHAFCTTKAHKQQENIGCAPRMPSREIGQNTPKTEHEIDDYA